MKCYRAQCLALLAVATAASLGFADNSEPQSLPLNQIPKAVMTAVLAKFPSAKPQSAVQGIEDNQPFIDVHVLVNNQKVWVTCDPKGPIREIDREITLKDLPPAVSAALNKKYPQAKVRLINEITAAGPPVYDIAVTFQKKPVIGIFTGSGEFLEELEDQE